MSLSEIVAQIKELQVYANENVEEGPAETLSGRRGRKAQAIDNLSRLSRQYRREMLQGAIFIVVTGAQKEAFSEMATANFKCFAADPETFYNDLSNRISPSLYLGQETISNMFDVVGRYLEDKMMELEVTEYPQLIFKQQYHKTVKTQEEFTALVKQAINDQVGAEIVGIQAIHSLVSKAIEANYTGKLTPIVLATDDEAFLSSLTHDLERLTRRVFTVVVGKSSKTAKAISGAILVKEPTEEAVGQVMTTINNSLKR